MKKIGLLLIGVLALAGTLAQADTATEQEVKKFIIEANAYTKETLKGKGDGVSKDGSLEFWSSGGLLQEVSADADPGEFDTFNIDVKHIHIVTLVPGEIVVAQFYSEGSMSPKNSSAVSDYRTRATQVLVKEGGKWKVRAAHWSPITAGSGTSQTAVDD